MLPENAWEVEAGIEKRFWTSGAVVLSYTHALVEDAVDFVPVASFDSPGNIGRAERGKAALDLALPLHRLGVSDASLRVNGHWTWSQVDDPVTSERRRISRHPPVGGTVLLTKEFSSLDSTLSIEGFSSHRETQYRIGEIRTDHWDHLLRMYWDWTPRSDTVVRLMFNNFTDRPRTRWRTVYDGSRAGGEILYHEDRYVDTMRFVQIQVRKIF